jgi:hypothetical protein
VIIGKILLSKILIKVHLEFQTCATRPGPAPGMADDYPLRDGPLILKSDVSVFSLAITYETVEVA